MRPIRSLKAVRRSECLVKCQDCLGAFGGNNEVVIESDGVRAGASLYGTVALRVIDKDIAHRPRGEGEKVLATQGSKLISILEADVC